MRRAEDGVEERVAHRLVKGRVGTVLPQYKRQSQTRLYMLYVVRTALPLTSFYASQTGSHLSKYPDASLLECTPDWSAHRDSFFQCQRNDLSGANNSLVVPIP